MKAFGLLLACAFIQGVLCSGYPPSGSKTFSQYDDFMKEIALGEESAHYNEKPCDKHTVKEVPMARGDDSYSKTESYIHKPAVVDHSVEQKTQKRVYVRPQQPIIVRPASSQILVKHPPVVVRQPPVILYHQNRSPIVVKPIIIKEKESAAHQPLSINVEQSSYSHHRYNQPKPKYQAPQVVVKKLVDIESSEEHSHTYPHKNTKPSYDNQKISKYYQESGEYITLNENKGGSGSHTNGGCGCGKATY